MSYAFTHIIRSSLYIMFAVCSLYFQTALPLTLFFFFTMIFVIFLLTNFGHWEILVIFLVVLLKLAVTVFIRLLYFLTFWLKWLKKFFRSFKKISVYDWKKPALTYFAHGYALTLSLGVKCSLLTSCVTLLYNDISQFADVGQKTHFIINQGSHKYWQGIP